MSTTARYLKTLRRIPDDIVLSMATREIVPQDSEMCICGWALREALAPSHDIDAVDVDVFFHVKTKSCARRFGGDLEEWEDLFWNISNPGDMPLVESAFVTRVMEAAGVAS